MARELDGSIAGDLTDPRIGSVLQGRYRIVKLLGTGGMGQVYSGERVGLGRPVAIKFLHSAFAREPSAVKRFEREAKAMSRLSHPNCVSVIDVGFDDTPYIVMDHVTGRSLCDVLDDGLLRVRRVIDITRQILSGLTHAHSQGVVHRDIKPGNIMLSEVEGKGDHVSILDFGLAKFRDNVLMQDITASAMLVGTPGYMSPEQTQGEEASASSDLYAVGVLLFEMLTDHKPYQAEHPLEVLRMHREAPIPSVRAEVPNRDVPKALEAVVNKALAKEPDERYGSADEFSRALERVARQLEDKRRARRRSVAKAGVAAAALGVVCLAVFVFASGNSSGHQTSVTAPAQSTLDQSADNQVLTTKPTAQQTEPTTTTRVATQSQPQPQPKSIEPPASALPNEAPITPEPPKEPKVDVDQTVKKPRNLRDVRRLIARKRYAAAIRGLLALRRKNPRNAYFAYLIADLCMKREMWNAAITHYQIAIARNKAYRFNRQLIRNAIYVLSSLRARDRHNAHRLLVYTVGRPALKDLRRTSKYSKSKKLRHRARRALAQIRYRIRRRRY